MRSWLIDSSAARWYCGRTVGSGWSFDGPAPSRLGARRRGFEDFRVVGEIGRLRRRSEERALLRAHGARLLCFGWSLRLVLVAALAAALAIAGFFDVNEADLLLFVLSVRPLHAKSDRVVSGRAEDVHWASLAHVIGSAGAGIPPFRSGRPTC